MVSISIAAAPHAHVPIARFLCVPSKYGRHFAHAARERDRRSLYRRPGGICMRFSFLDQGEVPRADEHGRHPAHHERSRESRAFPYLQS